MEDIDIFIAGVVENNCEGGLVGATFACMIGRQFRALRHGDRFWYETSGPEGFSLGKYNGRHSLTGWPTLYSNCRCYCHVTPICVNYRRVTYNLQCPWLSQSSALYCTIIVFTDQLNEIRKMTLSRILCSMSDDVAIIQPHAFRLPTKTG